ncbi:unnamed protein product [Thelazia callipaeda]|uniref:Coiled-coil domain-containing protein 177 n=1 Tax=Thelazia callipaeda TaxID=103827 RepID=A0A0N5D3I0_THECL|nr:unnamed protein product [Thelazia callipaeda]
MEKWRDLLMSHGNVSTELIEWPKEHTLRLSFAGSESKVQMDLLMQSAAACGACSELSEKLAIKTEVCKSLPNSARICEISEHASVVQESITAWMPEIFALATKRKHHSRIHSTQQSSPVNKALQQSREHSTANKRHHQVNSMSKLVKLSRRKRALKHVLKEGTPNMLEMDNRKQKLLCKYRRSCYETGIIPEILSNYEKLAEMLHMRKEPVEEKKEKNEKEIKILCRYRLSCYREVGINRELEQEKAKHSPLFSKQKTARTRRPKTVNEIARIALARIQESERIAATRPIPKSLIVKKKLNEIEEEKNRRLACKYRESCYRTGIIPHTMTFSEALQNIYHLLVKYIPLLVQNQDTTNKEFNNFSEYDKRLYCKYRKSCYISGDRPAISNITYSDIFQHTVIAKKTDELLPLQLRCKYRKSCYDTGILAEFNMKRDTMKEEKKEKPDQAVKSLYDLKMLCKYRKSCYMQKAQEQQFVNVQDAVNESQRLILQMQEAQEKKETMAENILSTLSSQKESTQYIKETAAEEKETHIISQQSEPSTKVNESKDLKDRMGIATLVQEDTDATKVDTEVKSGQSKDEKTMKTKNAKAKNTLPRIKQKSKKGLEVLPTHAAKSASSSQKTAKTTQVESLDATVRMEKLKREQRMAKERQMPTTQTAHDQQEGGDKKRKNESISHLFATSITQTSTTSSEQELEKNRNMAPPKLINISDDRLSPLDIKILCKYRKSCYKSGEVPSIQLAKTIQELRKKDENYQPLQIRCKYRKSCYETGKQSDNFTSVTVTEENKKVPVKLRCKYRKSCYQTGQLPATDKYDFGLSFLRVFLKEFDAMESTEMREKEMSEKQRKLFCKYRKSCYKTGKLPIFLNQTVHVIVENIKEQYKNPQLKCKYRKSCYESMKLDILLDKVRKKEREKKTQEGIAKSSYQANIVIKYKEKEIQREVSSGDMDEESKRSRIKRSKQLKSESDEEEYMQTMPLDSHSRQKAITPQQYSKAKKLKCKYRLTCYRGEQSLPRFIANDKYTEKKKEINIRNFRRPNGAICNIYYLSCRKQAGLPIRERAPIGPNGRRLCRKKKKDERSN